MPGSGRIERVAAINADGSGSRIGMGISEIRSESFKSRVLQRLVSRTLFLAVGVHWLALTIGAVASSSPLTLQTGAGAVLQRMTVPLTLPSNSPSASLRFDFAFGTDERLIPGEFLDSFTVTLRTTNRSHSITVLTVDRFGVAWTPGSSPGNLINPDTDLRYGPSPAVPSTITNFDFFVIQSVLLQLPAAFLNQESQLVLTLFDNDDVEHSRAIFGGVSMDRGNPSRISVESSAAVGGPYSSEDGFRVDPLLRTITIPKAGLRRFYRLKGETPSRVLRILRAPSGLVFDYEKEIGQPVLSLLGSNNPDGPFVPVNNATINDAARRISVPLLNAPGFFRLGGSHPARIINDEVSGNQRILDYEVFPVPPGIESSTQSAGPFAAEIGVAAEPFLRRVRLPDGGMARFYRVVADVPLLIRETILNGEDVVLRYE